LATRSLQHGLQASRNQSRILEERCANLTTQVTALTEQMLEYEQQKARRRKWFFGLF